MNEAAAGKGAVCLDGSPGGYYLKRGDPKRWILFMQGGGWCTSTEGCTARVLNNSYINYAYNIQEDTKYSHIPYSNT